MRSGREGTHWVPVGRRIRKPIAFILSLHGTLALLHASNCLGVSETDPD